jgi:hypothetical protein
MPSSASSILRRPSKSKGLVTTATLSEPSSLAMRATMGAPPVPVPPPMPAVINTMSAPFRVSRSLSSSSRAAFSPISGMPPAPRPPVSFVPRASLDCALAICSAWRSVLAAMNWTFFSPVAIIRFTALLPPPPTPITLITVRFPESSSANSIFMFPSHEIYRIKKPRPRPVSSRKTL